MHTRNHHNTTNFPHHNNHSQSKNITIKKSGKRNNCMHNCTYPPFVYYIVLFSFSLHIFIFNAHFSHHPPGPLPTWFTTKGPSDSGICNAHVPIRPASVEPGSSTEHVQSQGVRLRRRNRHPPWSVTQTRRTLLRANTLGNDVRYFGMLRCRVLTRASPSVSRIAS